MECESLLRPSRIILERTLIFGLHLGTRCSLSSASTTASCPRSGRTVAPANAPKWSDTVRSLSNRRVLLNRVIAGVTGLASADWSEREEHCVAGKQGRKLLRKSVKRTHKLGVQKSATVLLGNRVIWSVRSAALTGAREQNRRACVSAA